MITCTRCGKEANLTIGTVPQKRPRRVIVHCPWGCGHVLYEGTGLNAKVTRFTPTPEELARPVVGTGMTNGQMHQLYQLRCFIEQAVSKAHPDWECSGAGIGKGGAAVDFDLPDGQQIVISMEYMAPPEEAA